MLRLNYLKSISNISNKLIKKINLLYKDIFVILKCYIKLYTYMYQKE